MPKNKARVTVVWRGATTHERTFVMGNGRSRRCISLMMLVPLRREDYGLTWVHGWTGRDVDALKTAVALAARPG